MTTPSDQYRDTTLAFEDMIVQVGEAIATSQGEMDRAYLDGRREALRAFNEGRLARLDPRAGGTAYAIPETSLKLRMMMSMSDAGAGQDGPTLEVVPLNANSTGETNVDLSATTEIDLRFVAVPEVPQPPTTSNRLTPEAVRALIDEDMTQLDSLGSSRLWLATALRGREPDAVAVVDDRRGSLSWAARVERRPTADEISPVGPPSLASATPARASFGEIVEVTGDDLFTLGDQTVLEIDGRPVPIIRNDMRQLSFKLPEWASAGDLRVHTPLGTASLARAFVPIPRLTAISPRQAQFDSRTQRGTWLSLSGTNLRPGCGLRFAGGVEARRVVVESPTRMKVEVPEGTRTGPVTLTLPEHEVEHSLATPLLMLPFIESVSPRQASVGATIELRGNQLANVRAIRLGEATIERANFDVQTRERIELRVPAGASDGRVTAVVLDIDGEPVEVESSHLFYVVPRILGFGQRIVVPGQRLEVLAEGLDPNPEMMTLLFDAVGGVSEAPVIAVSQDRSRFWTKVPDDAVTGYLLLLRKRIFSGRRADDTSHTSDNKLTVLSSEGAPIDVVLDERFETPELQTWTTEAGAWSVERGQLGCVGTGRLAHQLPEPRRELVLHTEVLRAARFGVSLQTADPRTRAQLWVNLGTEHSSLTWSTLDSRSRRQRLVASAPLVQLPGGDHLLSLRVRPAPEAPDQALELRVDLDQVELHRFTLELEDLLGFALLSDDVQQRWDNVVALSRDVLRLPAPGDYRFAALSPDPDAGAPIIEDISPASGGPGVSVTVRGANMQEVVRVFVGGAEALPDVVEGDRVVFAVPTDAASGPIELYARGGIVRASAEHFLVPAEITGIEPRVVAPGETLRILGRNLPAALDEDFAVSVLGVEAEIVSTSPEMLSVRVPEVDGRGGVALRQGELEHAVPGTIEVVGPRRVIDDLLARADEAVWIAGGETLSVDGPREPGTGSVARLDTVVLEDGEAHGPALLLGTPQASFGPLRGVLPEFEVPEGGASLQAQLGFAPGRGEVEVLVELMWVDAGGEVRSLVPTTVLRRDGVIDRFIAELPGGSRGQVLLSMRADDSSATPPEVVLVGLEITPD